MTKYEFGDDFKPVALEALQEVAKGVMTGSIDDLIIMSGGLEVTSSDIHLLTSNPLFASLKLLAASETILAHMGFLLDENEALKEILQEKVDSISACLSMS